VHFVGFIIRIYHDARSSECQILAGQFCFSAINRREDKSELPCSKLDMKPPEYLFSFPLAERCDSSLIRQPPFTAIASSLPLSAAGYTVTVRTFLWKGVRSSDIIKWCMDKISMRLGNIPSLTADVPRRSHNFKKKTIKPPSSYRNFRKRVYNFRIIFAFSCLSQWLTNIIECAGFINFSWVLCNVYDDALINV